MDGQEAQRHSSCHANSISPLIISHQPARQRFLHLHTRFPPGQEASLDPSCHSPDFCRLFMTRSIIGSKLSPGLIPEPSAVINQFSFSVRARQQEASTPCTNQFLVRAKAHLHSFVHPVRDNDTVGIGCQRRRTQRPQRTRLRPASQKHPRPRLVAISPLPINITRVPPTRINAVRGHRSYIAIIQR